MNHKPCTAVPSRSLPQHRAWTLLANAVSVIIVAIFAVALRCRAATQLSPTSTIVGIVVVKVLILFSPKCVDRLEEEEYKKKKMLDNKKKHVRTYLSFVRLVRLVCLVCLVRFVFFPLDLFVLVASFVLVDSRCRRCCRSSYPVPSNLC